MTNTEKLWALLTSYDRFWPAVVGLIVIVTNQWGMHLDPNQLLTFAITLVGWIVAVTQRKPGMVHVDQVPQSVAKQLSQARLREVNTDVLQP